MADNSLKHLNRNDLIDIVYQMKKREVELEEQLAQVQKELEAAKTAKPSRSVRTVRIKEPGSIAEETVGVSNIFALAQKTADEYLARIQEAYPITDERCKERERECERICAAKLLETDRIIAEKWKKLQDSTEIYLSGQSELDSFFNDL